MMLTLPWPPSVNHYWRHVGGQTLISREGRLYREHVCALLAARCVRPRSGRLTVRLDLHPPDRRRRDIDNVQKALLDALAHGGAYLDDSQIDRLEVQRCSVEPPGHVDVEIVDERAVTQ